MNKNEVETYFNKVSSITDKREQIELLKMLENEIMKDLKAEGNTNQMRLGGHPSVPSNAFTNSENGFTNILLLSIFSFVFELLFIAVAFMIFK